MVQKIFAIVLSVLVLILLSVGTYRIVNNTRDRAVESGTITVEESQEVDKDKALMYNLFNILYWRNINGQK